MSAINGNTTVVGVIGDPISHTRSPAMHNAAIRSLGLNWVYVPFHVTPENLPSAVAGFRASGVRGINATIPHKEALIPLVDKMSPEAEFVGAINTLVFEEDGRIYGDNTDARGFLRAMEEVGFPSPKGSKVVVMGAGGASRAVVAALARAGASEIVVANRTASKAHRLADELSDRMGVTACGCGLDSAGLLKAAEGSALLVNTTSAGMHTHDALSLPDELFAPTMRVYDIIYAPPETPLLRQAANRGCQTLNGLGMLVHQGAIALELWSGKTAPVEVMRDALIESLA
ncbi:MAG: shikimate dehydrogenase [Candidatus Poribacteria bacterium]|nr:shikimate dehydrogenase [Candidatus Poribacteria bacterium]